MTVLAGDGGGWDVVLRGGRVIDPDSGLDGVTTALELEAGAAPVATAYRGAQAQGRPVNYGFATSRAQAGPATVTARGRRRVSGTCSLTARSS